MTKPISDTIDEFQHMEEIDGIVLACRERMMELAGNDSLKL